MEKKEKEIKILCECGCKSKLMICSYEGSDYVVIGSAKSSEKGKPKIDFKNFDGVVVHLDELKTILEAF